MPPKEAAICFTDIAQAAHNLVTFNNLASIRRWLDVAFRTAYVYTFALLAKYILGDLVVKLFFYMVFICLYVVFMKLASNLLDAVCPSTFRKALR